MRALPSTALISSLVLSFLAPASVARAARTLSEDTVWSGTAVVDEDLEVASGVTLRIEAGTTVSIGPSVSIRVSGRLLAEGTESEPVRFTRQAGAGSWGRLMFIRADDSRLEHAIVEFSDSEGDHLDYYDDTDSDCNPTDERAPRDYREAVVVIASHVDFDSCIFRNLPDDGSGGEGDAIAVFSDDPENPGEATANIRNCRFVSIGQGIHTRYSYVLVEDCFFTDHNGDNDDVDLYGESTPPPLIRNNVFLDPADDDMINPTKCSAVLIGNIIAGSNDHGIVLRDRCDPVLINNWIYDCSSAGIAVQNTCDALLVNNTIVDSRRGVRFFDHTGRWDRPYCLQPGSGRATLINTIIWNCPTPLELSETPYEGDHGSHATVSYSIIDGGQDDASVSASSTLTWEEGNINADPLFVDADAGDLRLREGSPAIDAGTAEGASETDIDGNPRPCGDGVDMGASEFGDCASPPEGSFVRGDANGDGARDITDPIAVLLHLFADRAEPSCAKSADADDSGDLKLADAVFLLAFLFQAGDVPPAPGATCGLDPTEDELTCASYAGCP